MPYFPSSIGKWRLRRSWLCLGKQPKLVGRWTFPVEAKEEICLPRLRPESWWQCTTTGVAWDDLFHGFEHLFPGRPFLGRNFSGSGWIRVPLDKIYQIPEKFIEKLFSTALTPELFSIKKIWFQSFIMKLLKKCFRDWIYSRFRLMESNRAKNFWFY